jgi:hypothetical protein
VSNPQKRKGTSWESAVRDWLNLRLPSLRVERIPAGATHDRGDLTGLPGIAVECKSVARIDLATIVNEARREAGNVGPDVLPLAVIKRRGHGPANAYAVMPLDAWTALYERTLP